MVFHLDKCIGCHTCSIACKNLWTDRKGTDYMWWNNVETKPGTGYPTCWEDQDKYQGGWEKNGSLNLRSTNKSKTVANIFHNPNMPSMDDYYEPWTYDFDNLFLSHADRSRVLPAPAVAAMNGFMRANVMPRLVLVDGMPAGDWTVRRAKGISTLTVHRWEPIARPDEVEAEARRLLAFLAPRDAHAFAFLDGPSQGS